MYLYLSRVALYAGPSLGRMEPFEQLGGYTTEDATENLGSRPPSSGLDPFIFGDDLSGGYQVKFRPRDWKFSFSRKYLNEVVSRTGETNHLAKTKKKAIL